MLHRDLKSANVFLTKDNDVKLGDLNVSKVAKYGGLLLTQTGTPYYASPEVWKDSPYDNKSDIWSLGCILYEMVTLKPPFRSSSMDGLYKKVTAGEYTKIEENISADLHKLIGYLLSVNPQKRPSCAQILDLKMIKKRMAGSLVNQSHRVSTTEACDDLLKTIMLPKNFRQLSKILPGQMYQSSRQKKEFSLP